jgi:hypothetical protein
MREIRLSLPEFLFVVGTRAMLAGGLAFLIANRLSREQRTGAGVTLALAGALATIPSAIALFGRRDREGETAGVAVPPESVIATDAPAAAPAAPKPKAARKRTARKAPVSDSESG